MLVFLSYKKFIGEPGSRSNTTLRAATAFHRETEALCQPKGAAAVGGVRLSSPPVYRLQPRGVEGRIRGRMECGGSVRHSDSVRTPKASVYPSTPLFGSFSC